MNIYETLVHAVVHEYGSNLQPRRRQHDDYETERHMWKSLWLVYGEGAYALPAKIGIPTNTTYNFPNVTVASSLNLGIAPSEVWRFGSLTEQRHRYTPLHVATALYKYGDAEAAAEARIISSPRFLIQNARTDAASFASNTDINPFSPEECGVRRVDTEDLLSHLDTGTAFDELGNAAWFDDAYVLAVLKTLKDRWWYSVLARMDTWQRRWEAALREEARRGINLVKQASSHDIYTTYVKYYRALEPRDAKTWLQAQTGIARAVGVTRADADVKTMAASLSVLINSYSPKNQKLMQCLGRPLTPEDIQGMTARVALEALYKAPLGAIQDLSLNHREAVSARFFDLVGAEHLPKIRNAFSAHTDRIGGVAYRWMPDTPEGNADLYGQTHAELKAGWEGRFKPLITDYMKMRDWRAEFLQAAPKEVLFLAHMRWAHPKSELLPLPMYDNVLRSVSNITEIQNLIAHRPTPTKTA